MRRTVLEARGVGVAYVASVPILKGFSFVAEPGFYGLVGANGAGKTTLLRVLAGEQAPTEGTIRVRPTDAVIAYCPQTVDSLSDDVASLASSDEGEAAALRGRLALDPDDLSRWATLSPGERKRWQIGAALARQPEVLLLDEPTNHLDGATREKLFDALARYRGIGVVVSHDRSLLETLPRSILRVKDGEVSVYPGAYSAARALWEGERQARELAHRDAKRDVFVAERKLDAARRTQESASGSVSSRSRMKDKNDHDGSGSLRKGMARAAQARAGETVRVVRDEVLRRREEVPSIERDRTLGGKVFAAFERAPQANLFHLATSEIRSEDGAVVVLRDVHLTIGRNDRARITGNNGAGKSSLLRALYASNRRRMLYLPQELTEGYVSALMAELSELESDERGHVLSVFSALGSDPERLLVRRSTSGLSPGEARKLALSLGLGRRAWALVLDEPTNHLDLPTIERLEQALVAYPGCVLLVSHDDAFANTTTSRTLHVSDGTVR